VNILAIDPGNEQSAFVLYDDGDASIVSKGIYPNGDMLPIVDQLARSQNADACAIEMVASYGMAVGREVFETVFWIGRFAERWEAAARTPARRLVRRDMKMHLCGNNTAKDANIRQALIDRFGPGKDKAIGKKATPGPLYGVRADEWAALALAVTFADTETTNETAARQ
jgi:hypothetical protein